MATVRLQRRIHRPPRHKLRTTGNGPRSRGHALPAPRLSRPSTPVLKRGGPETAASPPARPPGARSTPPLRAPAWHLMRAPPPKFPREGLRDKSPSRNSPEVRGARPTRPSARRPPRAPAGPARAHAALCFLSSRALPTCSIRDVGLFLRGETLDDHPGERSRPRSPRVRSLSPRLPLSSRPI